MENNLRTGLTMKDKLSETQIISIIKQQASGVKVLAFCRKHSIA